ncbi:hypothetical protein L1987_08549 [Smallanthus sonchifolius]|uniref:Uncharacterized protein n=1 Tax=Smallanthus sonchifolius TaxID=185202 RepID=A0ACB9JM28_9ASTR|nr:hypothetical protein L1987_08549 [Smallanthus sonchifolius]
MKVDEKKKPKERRPFLASECRDLKRPALLNRFVTMEVNIVDVLNPSGRVSGYRYFSVAKNLPGVKELLEKPPELRKPTSSLVDEDGDHEGEVWPSTTARKWLVKKWSDGIKPIT